MYIDKKMTAIPAAMKRVNDSLRNAAARRAVVTGVTYCSMPSLPASIYLSEWYQRVYPTPAGMMPRYAPARRTGNPVPDTGIPISVFVTRKKRKPKVKVMKVVRMAPYFSVGYLPATV